MAEKTASKTESLVTLYWINGPLMGRSLKLPTGRFSFGQQPAADALLPLESDCTMVQLEIKADQCFLNNPVPCWINGEPVALKADQPFALPTGVAIDLAGQGIWLGPLKGTPVLPKRMTQTEVRIKQASPFARPFLRCALMPWKIQILISMVCLSAGLIGYRTYSLRSVQQRTAQARDIEQVMEWADQTLSTLESAQLHCSWQAAAKQVLLQGRCAKRSITEPSIRTLQQKGWRVKDQVIYDEQLQQSVAYLLKQFGVDSVEISQGTDLGIVNIVGVVPVQANWVEIERQLGYLPGLLSWQILSQEAERLTQLRALLKACNLSEKLSLNQINDKWILTGELSAEQEARLFSALAKLKASEPGDWAVSYQNMAVWVSSQNLLPAEIITIGGSVEAPFVELANGLKLYLGSRLPSGYEVVRIDSVDGVSLVRQDQRVQLPCQF